MSPPASDDDPFAILGLPRRFSIDEPALRAAQIRHLAAIHPDRAGMDAVQVADATRRSASINDAYRALASPIARADTILRLEGSPQLLGEALPMELLTEMMEIRESLDEAIASRDDVRLATLSSAGAARRAELLESITTSLDRAVAATAESKTTLLAAARKTLNQLRYVERVLERAAQADC